MNINKAIILNDQYNNTLVAIEELQTRLDNVDIDDVDLLVSIEELLTELEDKICNKKHLLIREIKH